MARTFWHSIVIASVACLVFFANLGETHLWDEDEGFFATTASEMFARHDWIVPYFNGHLFSHKPPFMYWMMMAGFETFGVTPFAARLGSAVFGVGTVLLTYFCGRRLFCPEVGLLAALILCSSLMFDVVARAATPDSYLVFFMMLSLYLFIVGRRGTISQPAIAATKSEAAQLSARKFPRTKFSVAMYAAMGMAVLVKGPIGVILPMAAVGLYLLCTTPQNAVGSRALWRERWLHRLAPFAPVNFINCLLAMKPLVAVTVVMLIAAPWFICVGWLTRGQFIADFFGVHNFGRFLHPMESHHGSIFYYPIAILIGFFPWSVFAGPTILDVVKRIRTRDPWGDACVLLTCWIVVIVGFFSLAGTKLPNYVLPAYPAIALLTACVLHRWTNSPATVPAWQPRACFGILGLIGVALLIGLPLTGTLQIRGEPIIAAFGTTPAVAADLQWLGLLGILPLGAAGASLWLYMSDRRVASVGTMVVGAILLAISILGFAAVRVDRYQYSERLANRILDASDGRPAKVGQFRHSRPTLVFYLRQPVEAIPNRQSLLEFFARNQNAFVVTTSQCLPDLLAHLPTDIDVVGEEIQFPKRGKVLLLGRVDRTSNRAVAETR